MTKPAFRQCLVVVVLLIGLHSSNYSQSLRSSDHNSSRSNRSRSAQEPNQGFVFRLNGSGYNVKSDSIARNASFSPAVSAHYYTGSWGVGTEFGLFHSNPHFNINDYSGGIRSFTINDISSSQWRTTFILAGPSYRKSLGSAPFFISADLLGGMIRMKAPSFSIKDATDGTLIADYYRESKNTTAVDNPLFAIKPSIRFEWFPGGGIIGMNVHASYLQAIGAQEISTYYRDLSKVNFDGLSQDEIRNQVLRSPFIRSGTKGPVSSYSFGAGITIQINHEIKSPRDAGSGMATGKRSYRDAGSGMASGKRVLPTVNKIEIAADDEEYLMAEGVVSPRDLSSGLPTGKMAIKEQGIPTRPKSNSAILSPRDMASGLPTGKRMMPSVNKAQIAIDESGSIVETNSCGPVTKKITNADGSSEEMMFSCAHDAAVYESGIAEKMSVAKQTPKRDFGDKMNSGLHGDGIIHRDLAARNIISGKLSWSSLGSGGIITNRNSKIKGNGSLGTMVVIEAREAGSGMATGKRSHRDAASGMATGKRQHRDSGSGMATGKRSHRDAASGMATGKRQHRDSGSGMATGKRSHRDAASGMATGKRQYKPVFIDNEGAIADPGPASVIANPLYQGNTTSTNNPLYHSASRGTTFNTHEGIENIYISLIDTESGEILSNTKTERSGEFFFANVPDGDYAIRIASEVTSKKGYDLHATSPVDIAGTVQVNEELVQLELITGKQDSMSLRAGKNTSRSDIRNKTVNTSRSNIKSDAKLNSYFQNGDIPTQEQRPGSPIGGIIVKGGKNPGGLQRIVATDEKGEFEFEGLEAGDYTFIIEDTIELNDDIIISVGK